MRKISTLYLLLLSLLPATSPSWGMEDPALSKKTGSSSVEASSSTSSSSRNERLEESPSTSSPRPRATQEEKTEINNPSERAEDPLPPPASYLELLSAELQRALLELVGNPLFNKTYENDLASCGEVDSLKIQAQDYRNRLNKKRKDLCDRYLQLSTVTSSKIASCLLNFPEPEDLAVARPLEEEEVEDWRGILNYRSTLDGASPLDIEAILNTYEDFAQASQQYVERWAEVFKEAPFFEIPPNPSIFTEHQLRFRKRVRSLYFSQLGLETHLKTWEVFITPFLQTLGMSPAEQEALTKHRNTIKTSLDALRECLGKERRFLEKEKFDLNSAPEISKYFPPQLTIPIYLTSWKHPHYPVYPYAQERFLIDENQQEADQQPLYKKLFQDYSGLWMGGLQLLIRESALHFWKPVVERGYRLYAKWRRLDPQTPEAEATRKRWVKGLTALTSIFGPVLGYGAWRFAKEYQLGRSTNKAFTAYQDGLDTLLSPPDATETNVIQDLLEARVAHADLQYRNRSPWTFLGPLMLCAGFEAFYQLFEKFTFSICRVREKWVNALKHLIPAEQRATIRTAVKQQIRPYDPQIYPKTAKFIELLNKDIGRSILGGYPLYKFNKQSKYIQYIRQHRLVPSFKLLHLINAGLASSCISSLFTRFMVLEGLLIAIFIS